MRKQNIKIIHLQAIRKVLKSHTYKERKIGENKTLKNYNNYKQHASYELIRNYHFKKASELDR